MAERDLIEQLDQALTASAPAGPEVTELLRVAAVVRDRPAEEFRASLKARLFDQAIGMIRDQRMEGDHNMATSATHWLRAGMRSITPYLLVPRSAKLTEFLSAAFGAELLMRVDRPDGSIMHGEIRVGDSVLELGEDPPAPFGPRPTALHYYVEDVDAVYRRALEAGAVTLHGLVNQDYGDREASVVDPAGNYWYLATHQGAKYVPEGLHSVTSYLHLRGTPEFIEFARKGLGAQVMERHESPDGTVAHAKIRIGDSVVEASEARGQYQPMPASLHLYTPNVDELYQRAIAAGATSISEPVDQPYGDRYAGVIDRSGNHWYLATHIKDVSF